MSPILFALVDAVLSASRKRSWQLRVWAHRRTQREEARATLDRWRSTWGER